MARNPCARRKRRDGSTATPLLCGSVHAEASALSGHLGAGGHVPGSHHGFSLCNPFENRP